MGNATGKLHIVIPVFVVILLAHAGIVTAYEPYFRQSKGVQDRIGSEAPFKNLRPLSFDEREVEGTRRVGFLQHHFFLLPRHLRSKIDIQYGKFEGSGRVYVKPGRGAYSHNYTFVEFSCGALPGLRFTIEAMNRKGNEVRFTLETPGEQPKKLERTITRYLAFETDPFFSDFFDLVFDIPITPGPARAIAIRDLLLRLDKTGLADRRTENERVGLGLKGRILNIPRGVTRQEMLIGVLASNKGENTRFIMCYDKLDESRFFIFENKDDALINPATGAPAVDTKRSEGSNVTPGDVPQLQSLFFQSSRSLLVIKDLRDRTFYPLRNAPGERHKIGFSRDMDIAIVKVNEVTSTSLTGTKGHGRLRGPVQGEEEWPAMPLLVVKKDLLRPEAIPGGADASSLKASKDHILFDESILKEWPDFLGFFKDGAYTYYKRLNESLRDGAATRVVYRRLGPEDILITATMQGDKSFVLDGVLWKVGPLKGKPVEFSGLINFQMLAAKYGSNEIMTLPPSFVEMFMPKEIDSPEFRRRRFTVPSLHLEDDMPVIKPSQPKVASRVSLESSASVEQKRLFRISEVPSAVLGDIPRVSEERPFDV